MNLCMYLTTETIQDPYYAEDCPLVFKDPKKSLKMIPINNDILLENRPLFTTDEINQDKSILKEAKNNTSMNRVRKFDDHDFISIRSADTDIPIGASFMLNIKEKLFQKLKLEPTEYFIIFITPDEILLADKTKYNKTNIKKNISAIQNKLKSKYGAESPILLTEVFYYDKDSKTYIEV